MYNFVKYLILRPVVAWLLRAKVTGEENIPPSGGVLLASNHLGVGETYIVATMLRRQIIYPAKAELFTGDRGPGSVIVAWFLKKIGMVPLDRSGGRTSVVGLQPVLDALREGGMVGIYPEGTRSPDGRLYKGRTGVARMALAARVPIIPVGVSGTQPVKKFGFLPWLEHPRVRIGEPLDFSAYAGGHNNQKTVRWVTDEVMAGIQRLTGQEYVDAYGSSVKNGSLSAEEVDARVRPRPGFGSTAPVGPTGELS